MAFQSAEIINTGNFVRFCLNQSKRNTRFREFLYKSSTTDDTHHNIFPLNIRELFDMNSIIFEFVFVVIGIVFLKNLKFFSTSKKYLFFW